MLRLGPPASVSRSLPQLACDGASCWSRLASTPPLCLRSLRLMSPLRRLRRHLPRFAGEDPRQRLGLASPSRLQRSAHPCLNLQAAAAGQNARGGSGIPPYEVGEGDHAKHGGGGVVERGRGPLSCSAQGGSAAVLV